MNLAKVAKSQVSQGIGAGQWMPGFAGFAEPSQG